MDTFDGKLIALIDGECNLCNGLVQFIIKRDHADQFRFAAQQTELGRRLLQEGGLEADHLTTFVLIDRGRYYTKSGAALRVFQHLGGGWRLFGIFRLLPRVVRDSLYNYVARRRYRWFGKRDRCMLMSPQIRHRFLD